MRSHNRRYLIELGLALVVYVLLLIASVQTIGWFRENAPLRFGVALLSMIGAGLVTWAVVRRFQTLDELERKIQLNALAWAFMGGSLFTLSWGFAEIAGMPKFPTFGFWPLLAALWIVGLFVGQLRYR